MRPTFYTYPDDLQDWRKSDQKRSLWEKCFDAQGQVALKLCKFNEDPIKNEGAIKSTTFFQALKGKQLQS